MADLINISKSRCGHSFQYFCSYPVATLTSSFFYLTFFPNFTNPGNLLHSFFNQFSGKFLSSCSIFNIFPLGLCDFQFLHSPYASILHYVTLSPESCWLRYRPWLHNVSFVEVEGSVVLHNTVMVSDKALFLSLGCWDGSTNTILMEMTHPILWLSAQWAELTWMGTSFIVAFFDRRSLEMAGELH